MLILGLGLGIVRSWPGMLWPWHKPQGYLTWYINNAITHDVGLF